jgi:peptidyl-prolyl cis-trans isomerase B (cyclophilin B)
MAGNRRERQLAREKHERQQARRAQAATRRKRNQRITAIIVIAALVLGGVAYVVVFASSSSEPVAEAPTPAPTEPAPTEPAPTEPASTDPASTDPASTDPASTDPASTDPASTDEPIAEPAVLDCGPAIPTRANDISFDAPGEVAAADSLTLTTTCGDIVIALDERAPQTVGSATFLAEQGFYDAVGCHRLTTEGIFVLQCGDPAGDGTGGPGYVVPDENLPADGAANYPAGTVAMANAGPGTAGSQFFIVYEDTTLPPAYTVWGQVTEGLDIVQEIASVGTEDGSTDGRPRQPMVIETATVQRS